MAANGKDVISSADKQTCILRNRSAITNTIRCTKCLLVYHVRCCELKSKFTADGTLICCEEDVLDDSFSSATTLANTCVLTVYFSTDLSVPYCEYGWCRLRL